MALIRTLAEEYRGIRFDPVPIIARFDEQLAAREQGVLNARYAQNAEYHNMVDKYSIDAMKIALETIEDEAAGLGIPGLGIPGFKDPADLMNTVFTDQVEAVVAPLVATPVAEIATAPVFQAIQQGEEHLTALAGTVAVAAVVVMSKNTWAKVYDRVPTLTLNLITSATTLAEMVKSPFTSTNGEKATALQLYENARDALYDGLDKAFGREIETKFGALKKTLILHKWAFFRALAGLGLLLGLILESKRRTGCYVRYNYNGEIKEDVKLPCSDYYNDNNRYQCGCSTTLAPLYGTLEQRTADAQYCQTNQLCGFASCRGPCGGEACETGIGDALLCTTGTIADPNYVEYYYLKVTPLSIIAEVLGDAIKAGEEVFEGVLDPILQPILAKFGWLIYIVIAVVVIILILYFINK